MYDVYGPIVPEIKTILFYYSLFKIRLLGIEHSSFTYPGRDVAPHEPRSSRVPLRRASREVSVPRRYLAPSASSHEDCRCSEAASLG